MRIATLLLGLALLTTPSLASARGGHHGLFGGAHHGHSINAWMGSRRLRLR